MKVSDAARKSHVLPGFSVKSESKNKPKKKMYSFFRKQFVAIFYFTTPSIDDLNAYSTCMGT